MGIVLIALIATGGYVVCDHLLFVSSAFHTNIDEITVAIIPVCLDTGSLLLQFFRSSDSSCDDFDVS
jgi:hypothetical protein